VLGIALGLLALAWVPATPAIARAQAVTPIAPEHEAALRTGLEQYDRGNYASAIATWEALLATIGEERAYKVLYNLGLAYQQIGDVTRAIERYRAFVDQVRARPYASAELVAGAADASARAGQLESTHGALHVKPPTRGGPVLTRVGTADARVAGYLVWLSPGTHSVELSVGTSRARTVRVEVVAGGRVEVDATDPEVLAPRPGATPALGPDDASLSTVSPWVVVGGVATVVSLALPIALFVVADGKRDDAEALGAGHSGYPSALSSYDSARTLYLVSYALPATLALTTAGIYLLGGKSKPSRPSARLDVGAGTATLSGRF